MLVARCRPVIVIAAAPAFHAEQLKKERTPKMALTERRTYPRWDASGVTAWMFVENGEPERCRVIDVSRNGVLIQSPLFLVPGKEFELALARTYRPNFTRLFRRWAQVTRSTRDTCAVVFVNPTNKARKSRKGV